VKLKLLYIFLLLGIFNSVSAQYPKQRQSVLNKLDSCTTDTCKVRYLNRLALLCHGTDFKKGYDYAVQALNISEKANYIKGVVQSYNQIGNAYWYNNNYVQALTYYFKAFKINDSIGDREALAESYYNIGWIKLIQQRNHKEVSYLYKSLALNEEFKNVSGIAIMYNTFGQYYLNYYNETHKRNYFDSSYSYYEKAIKYLKENNKGKTGTYQKFYGGLGDLFALSKNYDSAIYYKEKSSNFHLEMGDSGRVVNNMDDIAGYEFERGNIDKAIALDKFCYDYGKRTGMPDIVLSAAEKLNKFYFTKHDLVTAYRYLEESTSLDDSLHKQLYSTSLNDIENEFEIEKREINIKHLQQANEIQELKNERSNYFLMGASVIVLIILIILYLLVKQNKEKNITNARLSEQNHIITEKKKEIDKSIQYAKGIQNAVIPDTAEFKKQFPENFVFYSPKDVVSGDFYWLHDSEKYFYAIAADCTGHGVPGALMSIVSMDKLAQATFEKKLTEPASILEFLNIEIKKALKQHSEESKQKDGLDIALLRFDKKNNSVTFAGANRPLYLVRNGKLTEYKSDKVAIAGFTPNDFQFHQQEIQLQKNDCLYLSSDGYADQFGGPEAKKFMTRNFKLLLESVFNKNMKEQEKEIVENHLKWKGNFEQVDDILVIGIKIS
jgi:serine phosphatase RsbU (regulator of sigma subunit)